MNDITIAVAVTLESEAFGDETFVDAGVCDNVSEVDIASWLCMLAVNSTSTNMGTQLCMCDIVIHCIAHLIQHFVTL